MDAGLLSLFLSQLPSFNPMFYFSSAVLLTSVLGGLYLLLEWFRHGRRCAFLLYWGTGLLILDWFTIPTILAWSGEQLIYAKFNPLFSVTLPLAFLGYILIYFGLRLIARLPLSKKFYLLFLIWFLVAAGYYSIQFAGGRIMGSRLDLLIQIIFLLAPLQFLNLSALSAAWKNRDLFTTRVSKIGLIALAVAVLTILARYVFYVDGVFIHPPELALILIRLSTFYIITQILSILFLIAGFILVHKEAIARMVCSPAEKPVN